MFATKRYNLNWIARSQWCFVNGACAVQPQCLFFKKERKSAPQSTPFMLFWLQTQTTRSPTEWHGHIYRKQKQNAVCWQKGKRGKPSVRAVGSERALCETHESENERDAGPAAFTHSVGCESLRRSNRRRITHRPTHNLTTTHHPPPTCVSGRKVGKIQLFERESAVADFLNWIELN